MITLSSDFGSPYPAAMRGVILQQTDDRIVDVSHSFPRQDVETAAFWLREILPWFPSAVHCVVVDPTVGTDRAALVIRSGGHAFVGPDNGVLLPAARTIGEDDELEVFSIAYDAESSTFHGRDVFAPTAAQIADSGIADLEGIAALSSFDEPVAVEFPEPIETRDGVRGSVLVVDGFGNAITNISGEVLRDQFGGMCEVNGVQAPVERTYAAVSPGDRVVTVGSHGNVELAVNQGRGTHAFEVDRGASVTLTLR